MTVSENKLCAALPSQKAVPQSLNTPFSRLMYFCIPCLRHGADGCSCGRTGTISSCCHQTVKYGCHSETKLHRLHCQLTILLCCISKLFSIQMLESTDVAFLWLMRPGIHLWLYRVVSNHANRIP